MTKMSQKATVRKSTRKYLLIVGLITVISGLINLSIPFVLRTGINSQMKLRKNSFMLEGWKRLKIPVTIKVYVWNIQNPKQFLAGERAQMTQLGPYYYNFSHWKEIISWDSNKNTVKYWSYQSFNFDSVRSAENLSDKITVINVPIYIIAVLVKNLVDQIPLSFAVSPVVFSLLDIFFANHREGILKRLTVGELLNGYHLTILDSIETLTKPLTLFGIQLPKGIDALKDNKYGIISLVNTSRSGPFQMYTGLGNTEYGKFVDTEDKKEVNLAVNSKCPQTNGVNGPKLETNLTILGPFLERHRTIDVYNGKICKKIYIDYEKDSSVKSIPTYRFILPKSLLASPDKNPENRCNCLTPKNLSKCDGILDIGSCFWDIPIALSFPHFLHSSSLIRNSVRGMTPNLQEHKSFVDIEPVIGFPLSGSVKIQVNTILKPLRRLRGMEDVPQSFVPYIWIEGTAEIDEEKATWVMLFVYSIYAIDYGSAATAIIGIVILTLILGFSFYKRKTIFRPNSISEEPETVDKANLQSTKPPNEPIKQNFFKNFGQLNRTKIIPNHEGYDGMDKVDLNYNFVRTPDLRIVSLENINSVSDDEVERNNSRFNQFYNLVLSKDLRKPF